MDMSSIADRLAYVPVATACRMLRVSRQRVYQLLDAGRLSGHQVDGTWMVLLRSVQARLALLREEDDRRGDFG